MKFRDQMSILLWKNWTLKKRNPVMTAMEVLLPLVIFGILIVLRSRIQPVPHAPDFPVTRALPSAGLLPMVQSFCDGGVHDAEGFLSQPNSFMDVVMTILDGLTQLSDGQWPPSTVTEHHGYSQKRSVPNDGLQDFMRFAEERPQNFWKDPDKKKSDPYSTYAVKQADMLVQVVERGLLKHPQEAYKIFDQAQKLSQFQASLLSATQLAAAANSSDLPGNSTNQNSTNELPPICARYGLETNSSGDNDAQDWIQKLMGLWKGTEVFLCQYPRKDTDELPDIAPESTQGLQFGRAGGDGTDGNIIKEMVMRTLDNNPRITYAPAGTDADLLINQVIDFLEIFNDISRAAESWLVSSASIRERFDPEGKIQEARDNMTNAVPGKDDEKPTFPQFTPETVPEMVVGVVDSLDYMACYWLSLIDGEIDFESAFIGFPSEEDLVRYSHKGAKEDGVTVMAGIVFEMGENGSLPNHLTYKIRQNATITTTTKMIKDLIWEPGTDLRGELYLYNGFIVMQDLLERGFINLKTSSVVTEPGIYIQEFPYPCFIKDDIKLVLIEHMFPLGALLSWVFAVSMIVRSIVYEKENRLKEVMRLMGLRDSVHWLAWFTTSLTQITISVTLLTFLLKLGTIFNYSDIFLLWCIFMIYGLNAILFAFFISVFFDNAKIASAVGSIAYIITYVPYMIITILQNGGYQQSVWVKAPCSFFASTGMGLSASYLNFYETIGTGLTFENFRKSPMAEDDYSPFLASMMSLVSSAVYLVLVWYIDNVHPGAYGLPKPWYFPVTPTYWCGRPALAEERSCTSKLPICLRKFLVQLGCIGVKAEVDDMLEQARANKAPVDAAYFEEDPQMKRTIEIKDLTKVYSDGKLALDSLTLNLYEGQILSFLGHNGAGKTTTMSILTGMIPGTSGTAIINGKDIRTDMADIRQSLGMCPQHNVLFESLTVDEHLQFYARLKGTPLSAIDLELENMLEETGLRQKRYATVDSLSGGMKRKLSIGIAFISGSRSVILDEPTAGVDPWSRREIWDLILRCKEGRTIMMSTHHMDEADILGDRIAVISHGTLKCSGTSIFLKGTFGEGYHLIIAKKITPAAMPDLHSSDNMIQEGVPMVAIPTVTRCTEKKVSLFITSLVQGAYLRAETALELHYILPFSSIKNGMAGKLFDRLDDHAAKLHITGYGVSDTSLEEVFLKVTAYAKAAMAQGASSNDVTMNDSGESSDASSVRSSNRGKKLKRQKRRRSRTMTTESPDPTQLEDSLGRVYTADPIARTQRRGSDHSIGRRLRTGSLKTVARSAIDDFRRSFSWDVGMKAQLTNENELRQFSICEDDSVSPAGQYRVSGCGLWMSQFQTCLYKRCIFTARNWKQLASQIVLPVMFVAIAMVMGIIGGPSVAEEPALELSPAQYFNVSKALGYHYMPFSDHGAYPWSYNATPDDLVMTYKMPSGVGATCVLTSPDFDANVTYEPGCDKVLYYKGERLSAFPLEHYDPRAPLNGTLPPVSPDGEPVFYYPQCQCTVDNRVMECSESGFQDPPAFPVITGDILQNITSQNETAYFYYTADAYRRSRYGATTFGHVRSHVPYWLVTLPDQLKHIYAARVSKVWYNSRGWHSMPTFLNVVNNAILRANLQRDKSFTGDPAAYGITVINHPMEGTTGIGSVGSLIFGAELILAIFILVGFAFIPAGFLVFLVQERATNAKHLQFVSGLNPLVYWLANLFWDMVVYLLPVACCAGVLAAFQIPAFTQGQNYYAAVMLMLLFGWTCTPMMYPMSFVFNDPSTAYVALASFNIFTGTSLLFVTFMLDYLGAQEDLVAISHTMKQVFVFFPSYALGRGLMDIVLTKTLNEVNDLIGAPDSHRIEPFDWLVTGRNLAAMTVVGFTFYVLTILIEYRFFAKTRVMPTKDMPEVGKEDPDVAEERRRVHKGSANDDMVRIENLTKIYKTVKLGKHMAVQRLSLGIPQGECFGMLGVNGAGKTSTFKMMTGDIAASGGEAYIAGHSILKNINAVRKNIGYCPQFDALYEELTGRQHLKIYSKLRGIPKEKIDQVVAWALRKLELTEYADKPSGSYSGGNRRKLSTAIALLGDPPVIFLDEPTAGMDPYAKRFLWDLILNLVEQGKCIILTSHSMEECETLCTRLAIMVQGKFRCLGSVQHLKGRFGDGYNLTVTVKGPDYNSDIQALIKYMSQQLPNANIKERHFNLMEFEIQPEYIKLSEIFDKMEADKHRLNVEDYSVCQNTLDNVFINFVNEQNKDLEVPTSRQRRRSSSRKPERPSVTLMDLEQQTTLIQSPSPAHINWSFACDDDDLEELEAQGMKIKVETHL